MSYDLVGQNKLNFRFKLKTPGVLNCMPEIKLPKTPTL